MIPRLIGLGQIGNNMHRKRRVPISDRTTLPIVKFGGGNTIIWGCMDWNGVGMLTEV